MRIAHCELKDLSGHEAGRKLLADLYREETGRELPPILISDRGKPYFEDGSLHFSILPIFSMKSQKSNICFLT